MTLQPTELHYRALLNIKKHTQSSISTMYSENEQYYNTWDIIMEF